MAAMLVDLEYNLLLSWHGGNDVTCKRSFVWTLGIRIKSETITSIECNQPINSYNSEIS